MTLDEINTLSDTDFVARFGFLFEGSPWIVLAAERLRPFESLAAFEEALLSAVRDSNAESQLALLRAHPELAGKAAIAKELSEESNAEQASVGLDRLTPEEYALFHRLNDAYRAKFDFPFIVCVRLTDKAGILAAMHERTGRSREEEFDAALSEVGKIVRLRLQDALA